MKAPMSLDVIEGFSLQARDGNIGKVKNFYFDDSNWKIKYAVVQVGSWLNGHEVLIKSSELGKADLSHSIMTVALTKDQITQSPDKETDLPIEGQHEADIRSHMEYGVYFSWGEGFIGSHNFDMPNFNDTRLHENFGGKQFDSHLRGANFMRGCELETKDGILGKIKDFIIDDEEWTIRNLIVDIGTIFESKRVIIPCEWITGFKDEEMIVTTSASKDQIKNAPSFDYRDI